MIKTEAEAEGQIALNICKTPGNKIIKDISTDKNLTTHPENLNFIKSLQGTIQKKKERKPSPIKKDHMKFRKLEVDYVNTYFQNYDF